MHPSESDSSLPGDNSLNAKFSGARIDRLFGVRKIIDSKKSDERENVGWSEFELTIDGSLRHASVLQRVIIKHRNFDELSMSHSDGVQKDQFSRTHCSSSAARRTPRPLEPYTVQLHHDPLGHAGLDFSID